VNWSGLMIVVGYAAVIAVAWPWGLLAVAAHILILLATVKR
jgi:hypothetical protein